MGWRMEKGGREGGGGTGGVRERAKLVGGGRRGRREEERRICEGGVEEGRRKGGWRGGGGGGDRQPYAGFCEKTEARSPNRRKKKGEGEIEPGEKESELKAKETLPIWTKKRVGETQKESGGEPESLFLRKMERLDHNEGKQRRDPVQESAIID